jgi:hypothetical protein
VKGATPDSNICCWYHNNGGCKKSQDECAFLHQSLGKDNIDKIPSPYKDRPRQESRGRSAAPGERGRSRTRSKGSSSRSRSKSGSRSQSRRSNSRDSSRSNRSQSKDRRGNSPGGRGRGPFFCKHFQRGSCRFGDSCRHAHLNDDLSSELEKERKRIAALGKKA